MDKSVLFARWDKRSYLVRLGDVTSQWFNVALFNGMPDESISGRSYLNTEIKEEVGGYVKTRWIVLNWLANKLFFLQKNHTKLAYYEDIERSSRRAQHIHLSMKARGN